MIHNFNIEIFGVEIGIIVDMKSYWGIYKMAPKPFKVETINAKEALSYAYYALTNDRRIQRELFKAKSVKL